MSECNTPSVSPGYELLSSAGKGDGVYATKEFKRKDLVMRGNVEKETDYNTPWSDQAGIDRFIVRDGLASKVNHSCSPNVGYQDNQDGGMDYIAFRDIQSGDEIVVDYAMGNYKVEHMPECLCGSAGCRKSITGWKDLSDEIKKEYEGFHVAYLIDLDAINAK